jgi:hypothetical protein
MPRWLPSLRRRSPTGIDPALIAALAEAFGEKGVEVLKQTSTTFGGLLAMVRIGQRTVPRRGQEKLLQAYAEMPWVRAVVGKIAESIAATEWVALRSKNVTDGAEAAAAARFYSKAGPVRRKRLRKQMELEELPGHALLDLLEKGNDFHTGQTIDELTQAHLELVGEAFWLKERNGRGQPTELWSIPPNWVVDTPAPGKTEQAFLFRVDGVETSIPMSEVIWYKKADPWLPYGRGVGTGRSLGDELDTDEYAAKHMKAWFVNGAIPDLLVSADGLAPGDTERLEQDWLDKQQGWWNRFKPYFVGKKLSVEKLTSSFQEMGLGQLRKDQRDVIIHTWGVAPEMFGITENSNRANITGAFYQYARWVLVPRLELRRVFMQTRLVPDFDPGLIIDYESPVEEDKAHVLSVMTAAPWAFTADEWREEAGRAELEDDRGNVHAVPFNLIFTDELGSVGAIGGGGGGTPAEPDEPEEPEEPEGNGPPANDPEAPTEPEVPATAEPSTKQPELSPEAEQVIGEVIEAIQADTLDDAIRPIMGDTVVEFGKMTVDDLTPEYNFDELNPFVVEHLKHGRKQKIVGANNKTRSKIRKSLSDGMIEGESLDDLQERVEQEFIDAIGRRAYVISRTETVNAANFGAMEGIKQSGLPYKSWLAVVDDATRPGHAEMGAEPPIPLGDIFVNPASGYTTQFPGNFGVASEDIQCRCSVLGEFAPEEGGAAVSRLPTEEQRAAAWRTFEADRQPFERRMALSVQEAFGEQQTAAVAALRRGT